MKVFGLTGGSGDDKADLLAALMPEFRARGLRVSVAKFINHPFDIDRPGKDSHAHRAAGATEVLVLSTRRWALLHENRPPARPDLEALTARMLPVDLLIAIGFHDHPHERLEIHREAAEAPLRCFADRRIVAVATDAPLPPEALPELPPKVLELADRKAIADFILRRCGLAGRALRVAGGGDLC